MDLSVLDKSSKVAPLLVRLYDSHQLHALAQDDAPAARLELTGVVADLIACDLSPREEELVTDVLIALIRKAERDLSQAIAERLAVMDNAPLRIILFLANGDIDVAGPVLRQSKVLNDLDLIYMIKSKTSDYWQAIAARRDLKSNVIDLLAETRDVPTASVLSSNKDVELTDHAMEIMADLAQDHAFLAEALIERDELNVKLAGRIYALVGEDLKKRLTLHFGTLEQNVAQGVDDIVLEFVSVQSEKTTFMPSRSMLDTARQLKDKGLLNANFLIRQVQRGQIPSFVAHLACYADLPPRIILEIIRQDEGRQLALLCRALLIQKAEFVSFYLLTRKFFTGKDIVDHGKLTRALAYFEKIRPEAAQRVVEKMRQNSDQTQ